MKQSTMDVLKAVTESMAEAVNSLFAMFVIASVVSMCIMLVVVLDPVGAGIPVLDRGLVMLGGVIVFSISLSSMLIYDILKMKKK